MEILKSSEGYYVLDTRLNIRYPLSEDKCLIRQVNDIAEIILLKRRHGNATTRNENSQESNDSI